MRSFRENVQTQKVKQRGKCQLNDEQKEKDNKGRDVIRGEKGVREGKEEYIFKSIYSFNYD